MLCVTRCIFLRAVILHKKRHDCVNNRECATLEILVYSARFQESKKRFSRCLRNYRKNDIKQQPTQTYINNTL